MIITHDPAVMKMVDTVRDGRWKASVREKTMVTV
jgi:hypothetical protein